MFHSPPVFSTPANVTSAPGIYPLYVSGVTAASYTVTYLDGMLTIRAVSLVTLNIPNTFTPNGDGINDQWHIGNISAYPNCMVTVFNRYGQPVYNSKGYTHAWDGQYRGEPVPVGNYFKNNSKTLSGSVTVIR